MKLYAIGYKSRDLTPSMVRAKNAQRAMEEALIAAASNGISPLLGHPIVGNLWIETPAGRKIYYGCA